MKPRLHIHAGRLIDPANGLDTLADLYVADGVVVSVGSAPGGFQADQVIDASGLIVCPGLVDLRAKLREPGEEHKATIASETLAAARAGITTLCCPPDTTPVIDTPAVARLIMERARHCAYSRVLPLGALTRGLDGQQLCEMAMLAEAGCCGVSNDRRPLANLLVLRRAMEYAATFGLTVFFHPQEFSLVDGGCAHGGAVATRLGLPGVPTSAETVAVAGILELVAELGVRTHFCLLSTARAAQLIARAQHDGLPVTADVSAHLHLTEHEILDFDVQCHVQPPLRTLRDRDGLRHWLQQGAIAAICSDHQPHESDAKLAPFAATASGISALETLLPLSLRLVDEGLFSLSDMIARLTCQPAEIVQCGGGNLAAGKVADICLFAEKKYWTVSENSLVSQGKNTPFLDWEMQGQVIMTILAGEQVYVREESP